MQLFFIFKQDIMLNKIFENTSNDTNFFLRFFIIVYKSKSIVIFYQISRGVNKINRVSNIKRIPNKIIDFLVKINM